MRVFAALIPGCLMLAPALAQPSCPATPAYSLCELNFDLNEQEAAAPPTRYVSVQLHADFRSPRHKPFLMPAFWAGGRRMVIRFAPDEPGDWAFRVTSNLERFNGITEQFQSTPSDAQ